jgi:hypothetical protein
MLANNPTIRFLKQKNTKMRFFRLPKLNTKLRDFGRKSLKSSETRPIME